jgi:7-cyano-7-deazaguanine synthase in queuosine biosynthesis
MAAIALVSGGWDSMAMWRMIGLPPALHVHTGNRAQEREHEVVMTWAGVWGGRVECVEAGGWHEWENGWVPFRNALLILLAAQRAPVVYLARVAEWAPDKNGRYLRRLERLATQGMRGVTQGAHGSLTIETPYAHLTKRGLYAHYGAALGKDAAADLWQGTWSCYEAGPWPCGTCAGCLQRLATYAGLSGRVSDGLRWLRDDRVLGARQMLARWREAR